MVTFLASSWLHPSRNARDPHDSWREAFSLYVKHFPSCHAKSLYCKSSWLLMIPGHHYCCQQQLQVNGEDTTFCFLYSYRCGRLMIRKNQVSRPSFAFFPSWLDLNLNVFKPFLSYIFLYRLSFSWLLFSSPSDITSFVDDFVDDDLVVMKMIKKSSIVFLTYTFCCLLCWRLDFSFWSNASFCIRIHCPLVDDPRDLRLWLTFPLLFVLLTLVFLKKAFIAASLPLFFLLIFFLL